MKLMSAYKYFFYRTYVQQLRIWGDTIPRFTALLVISFLMTLNLSTIFAWFEIVTGFRTKVVVPCVILLGLLLPIANYFFILYPANGSDIIKTFEAETELERKKRALWCWIYELGSFAVFFVSIFILKPWLRIE